MAAIQRAPDARSQPGKEAGLGAVVIGTLVAIAVAALFLVLIGASRTGRLTPPEHYHAVANPGQTSNPASHARAPPHPCSPSPGARRANQARVPLLRDSP
jgi:hypothetical protein